MEAVRIVTGLPIYTKIDYLPKHSRILTFFTNLIPREYEAPHRTTYNLRNSVLTTTY